MAQNCILSLFPVFLAWSGMVAPSMVTAFAQHGHHLKKLPLKDPLLERSSDEIILEIDEGWGTAVTAFSNDVEDLYCSAPHDDFLCTVREKIEVLGEQNFENSIGLSSDHLLTL